MTNLVFIGGAPGVGKSTVANELLSRAGNSVWLDGDDLWRVQPFIVNEVTKDMVEKNMEVLPFNTEDYLEYDDPKLKMIGDWGH